ncbi:hypothetical protein JCM11251_002355 [Rhodosporidiobolus azoricus]
MDGHPPPPAPPASSSTTGAISSAGSALPPSITPAPAPTQSGGAAASKAPQLAANGPPAVSSDQDLERELPTVVQDLVPLSYVIDRVVASAYADLANLVETLPSQPDQSRKRAIVDYVLHTRRQLVKLLVLTRWSSEAERVGKAMNIIGFLSSQNHLLTSTISSLTETSSLLPGARVRNYDLSTSLSVLTTGSYPALPSVVREEFANQGKMRDEEVLGVMKDVDEALRWRLVMGKEWVPRGMKQAAWRIADGRVTFSVPGLWEASFTYSGDGSSDSEGEEGDGDAGEGGKPQEDSSGAATEVPAEWFLLSLRFLFRVKDARGVPYSPIPSGPLKDHLIELCNQQLLRRPFLPPPFQASIPPPPAQQIDGAALSNGEEGGKSKGGEVEAEGEGAAKKGEEGQKEEETEEQRRETYERERREVVRKRRRDRPLGRAYTFLQRLALSYQLESVASQAAKLAATGWSGSLKVERRRAGRPVPAAGENGKGKEGEGEKEKKGKGKGKGKEKEMEGAGEEHGEEVRVEYWSHKPDPSTSSKLPSASTAPRPTTGGTLVISLRPPAPLRLPPSAAASASTTPSLASSTPRPPPPPSALSRTAKAREAALQAALARGSYSTLPPAPPSSTPAPIANGLPSTSVTPAPPARGASATPAPRPSATPAPPPPATNTAASAPTALEPADEAVEPDLPPSLLVTWLPPHSSASTSFLYPSTSTSLTFPSSSKDAEEALDVERVLRRVTRRHARDTVRRLAEEVRKVMSSGGGVGGEGERVRLVWPRRQGGGASGQEQEDEEEDEDEEVDEDEEDDGDDVRVPYLLFPLYPSASHAVGAFIDPQTGRFELRAVPPPPSPASLVASTTSTPAAAAEITTTVAASTTTLEPSSTRDQRLRLASERIDRERFNPPPAPAGTALSLVQEEARTKGWMRSVVDVVGRIRASTILDDLDTLALLLSLPAPTRRLPIPPRELVKFGPAFATPQGVQSGRNGLLFIPLQYAAAEQRDVGAAGGVGAGAGKASGGLEGFWLVLVLVADGFEAGAGVGSGSVLRPALVRTRDVSDGTSNWLEVAEVGWISLPSSSSPASSSATINDASPIPTSASTSFLPPSPSPQTLLSLWRYAVHRASLYKIEEALQARRIPFRVVFSPPASSSSASTSTTTVESAKPYLVLSAASLVRAPVAQVGQKGISGGGEVAWPNAAIQCVVNEEGAVRATLHARFRFPPASASSSPVDECRPDPSHLPPNVLYNPKQDVVVFVADGDLEGQVEKLLRAYATVASTVSNAQRNAPPPSSTAALTPSLSSAAPAGVVPPPSPSKRSAPTPAPVPVKSAFKVVNGLGVKPFG